MTERPDKGARIEIFQQRSIYMATTLEQEEYLYRRAIDIIESVDTDEEKEELLFKEVWVPLAALYKDKIVVTGEE